MSIDEADSSDAGPPGTAGSDEADGYSWLDFYAEYGEDGDVDAIRQATVEGAITPETFERAGIDPSAYLGFDPAGTDSVLTAASRNATHIAEYVEAVQEGRPPVVKGWYSWEDYKREYFYDDEGNPPTDAEGEPETFEPASALGFDPRLVSSVVSHLGARGEQLSDVVDERTVDVSEEIDEDEFFSTGTISTIANRYDLEKAVPLEKKRHFREVERYWVNKPFAFVVVFHSTKENEKKYYLIQPHMNEIEDDLTEFLTGKLRSSIKYAEEGVAAEYEDNRRQVIEDEAYELLERYDIYSRPAEADAFDALADRFGFTRSGIGGQVLGALGWDGPTREREGLDGIEARPESAVTSEDPKTLTEYQVEKLLYYLKRDFIGYERIDGIKHDINVEDISCDGYNSPVFVYHSDYEQIISNVYHGETELDDFVVKLAQRSGKGISKRSPQVDATLPDGSRAQLTLGREVSDHGTNYTIRQFKDVPFTPIDLINWNTFSLDEMAFLWLCIESNKSLIFAGGTASGKTTSLNAVSLFIPSNSKIVSIEDTREVELPQRNWIASVTRPSFAEDGKGDIDEFDLLEAALRQRPDYIVMGEIRGEEGRTLFQVMSTGHTTYTTFHADSVGEVLKRFTTEPINVSKTMFTALDLVSIQTATRVSGHKVRRNKTLTEINRYDAENDEINVQDVYQWQAETDQFLQMSDSNTLEEIKFDRGWDQQRVEDEIFTREAVLAYLLENGLNTYTQVAATFQAFINDPDTILTLMANEGLEESLEDLREMESVLIDIDPEKEEMVPRPDASDEMLELTGEILGEAEERLFEDYRGEEAEGVAAALMVDQQSDVAVEPGDGEALKELTVESDAESETAVATEEDGRDGTDVASETSADDETMAAQASSETEADRGDDERGIDRTDDALGADWGDDERTTDRGDGETTADRDDDLDTNLGDEMGANWGDERDTDREDEMGANWDGETGADWNNGTGTDRDDETAADRAESQTQPDGIDPDSILDETDITFAASDTDSSNAVDVPSSADTHEESGLFGSDDATDSFDADDRADSSETEDRGGTSDTGGRSESFDADEQSGSTDGDDTDGESPSQINESGVDPLEDERATDAGMTNGGTAPSESTGDERDTDELDDRDDAADEVIGADETADETVDNEEAIVDEPIGDQEEGVDAAGDDEEKVVDEGIDDEGARRSDEEADDDETRNDDPVDTGWDFGDVEGEE